MGHRTVHGAVPKYLINYFNRVRDVHSYSTRGSLTDFVVPRVKSNLGRVLFVCSNKRVEQVARKSKDD